MGIYNCKLQVLTAYYGFHGIHPAQKVPVFGAILVRIFPEFSRIRTEYGHIQSECEKMREKCGPE